MVKTHQDVFYQHSYLCIRVNVSAGLEMQPTSQKIEQLSGKNKHDTTTSNRSTAYAPQLAIAIARAYECVVNTENIHKARAYIAE